MLIKTYNINNEENQHILNEMLEALAMGVHRNQLTQKK